MPSAPDASAIDTSSLRSMLACSWMRTPSLVSYGPSVRGAACRPRWRRARASLFAAQVQAQPSGHIMQIALALVQVGILDVVEHRGNLVEGALHGPLGVDALGGDQVRRAADEHWIVQHEELRIEDGREVG